ncbi:MAG: hypothetical protein U0353_08185 [Sandaracinus sp.]
MDTDHERAARLRATPLHARQAALAIAMGVSDDELRALRRGELPQRMAARVRSRGLLWVGIAVMTALSAPIVSFALYVTGDVWLSPLGLALLPVAAWLAWRGARGLGDREVEAIEAPLIKTIAPGDEDPTLVVGTERFASGTVDGLPEAVWNGTIDGELVRLYVSKRSRMPLAIEPLG